MGTLRYKVVMRKNPMTKETLYYGALTQYSRISEKDIVDYAVQNSNMERATLETAMYGLEEAIKNFLLNGHNLQLTPLGTRGVYLSSRGTPTPEEFTSTCIRGAHIRFFPSPDLRRMTQKENMRFIRTSGPYAKTPEEEQTTEP